jgi:hypothetical protein
MHLEMLDVFFNVQWCISVVYVSIIQIINQNNTNYISIVEY